MMDTKEALKELEDLTVKYGNRNEEQIARIDEAIDMAMDALRNLPNRLRQAMDTISRQAAIELVKDVCDAIMSGCESWYDPETKDEVYADIHEVDAILKCNKEVRIALRNMPSAQPETCDTCKHGYFGDTQCDNCCVRYPSHYERRTDERQT